MSRPPYEILEHPADVGLKVYGRDLPELFANGARGLVELALELQPDAAAAERLPLRASGADREDLFVNWLSEVLYHIDAEGWALRDFEVRRVAEQEVEGEGIGQQSSLSVPRRVAVKAVTYHQIAVRQTAEGWEAVVYFDI